MRYEQQRIARSTRVGRVVAPLGVMVLLAGLLSATGCAKPAESPGPLDSTTDQPGGPDPTVDPVQPLPSARRDMPDNQRASEPSDGILMPEGANPEADNASDSNPEGSGGLEMPKDAPLESGSSTQTPVQIRYASWEEIERAATSTSQVTVVDLWSLSCEPCLKEFPGLVRLHQQLASSVVCIGVDVDFDGRKTRPPEAYASRVADFLDSVDAEFTNYISNTASDEIYKAVNVASIPAVLVFDADGRLVKKFADAGETAGFTYDKDVIPLVAKLAG